MTGPSLGERLLSLVFPSRCLLCGEITPGGADYCRRCQGPPAPLYRELPLDGGRVLPVRAAFPYEGGPRETLRRYKFQGERAPRKPLGRAMTAALGDCRAEAVAWAPLSPAKRRRRGYDQSELLAREVAKALGIPAAALLETVRETATQHELDRAARLENARGAYRARPEAAGKALLLVDDIVTTGATLAACAQALYDAGAREIFGLCAASAEREERKEGESP